MTRLHDRAKRVGRNGPVDQEARQPDALAAENHLRRDDEQRQPEHSRGAGRHRDHVDEGEKDEKCREAAVAERVADRADRNRALCLIGKLGEKLRQPARLAAAAPSDFAAHGTRYFNIHVVRFRPNPWPTGRDQINPAACTLTLDDIGRTVVRATARNSRISSFEFVARRRELDPPFLAAGTEGVAELVAVGTAAVRLDRVAIDIE